MAQFKNLEDAINADKKKMLKFVQEVPQTIASELKNQIVENFETESFDNKKWKPVNKFLRKEAYRTKPILFNTGNLKRSINIVNATWNEIKIQSSEEYAEIHNKGGINKNGAKVPKRQFMGHGKNADALIKKTLDEEMHDRGIVQ
jgi:phage gpG-like protein